MSAEAQPVRAQPSVDGAVRLVPDAPVARHLPVALTSFVGRELELAALREALATTRLVTVTGAGGCGKTRLAIHAAAGQVDAFPDGVWWVELAALTEPELVGAAVAEALGVRPLPGMTDAQAVCAYLAPRRSLLVLDNCEHLLDACAELTAAVLKAAPQVTVLATSRATLGVEGELDWRIPPLALSPDAVTLFVERARRARPDFAATDGNASVVADVCARLDGLPLAIELAAAWVRTLSVEQLDERLSDRFGLLVRGPRTASARQRTLRASVDWSHDLLTDGERRLLRRLAVFAGGFTLDASEQVCGGTVDGLEALVDQSLVVAEPRGSSTRYRLLETVREYGLERLREAGEAGALRDRHRDHFLALAEQAAPHLESRLAGEWRARLEPEAANLAGAIDHALRRDPAAALRLCAALYPFWRSRGRLAEAALAQSRALEAGRDAPPGLRARVLVGVAMRRLLGEFDPEAAAEPATDALALADQAGDRSAAARARCAIADALQFARPAAARAELDRAAELARAAGDDWALIQAHHVPAFGALLQSDHARVLRLGGAVAALNERVGDPVQVSRHWYFIGWAAVLDGRLEEARDGAERSRAALDAVWEPIFWGAADAIDALADLWSGRAELVLGRVPGQLERSIQAGAGLIVPLLMNVLASAELAAGRLDAARARLEQLVALHEGRMGTALTWALGLLAEVERLLGDDAAAATATRAQSVGEQVGNRLLATRGRLTLARLAAARGDWAAAQQHALEHLDACAEGGHLTWAPQCLDVLGEIAAGSGRHDDAVRLLAAAQRARDELGVARVLPEHEHWAALEARLRAALGDRYAAASDEGAALTLDDALGWVRRSRGSRARPAAGWNALTPTEAKVSRLVAAGLTNQQIGERMFISRDTVKTHLRHVFTKLEVSSRAELAALVARSEPGA